ncbi:MAG: FkbM family methyltransferase [Xanthobacteraceae bacterium]
MLTTKRKIALARVLNFAIVGARALAGRSSRVIARRRDVNWELELNEGIDLAIYLGLYQRIPRRAARWITPGALVFDIGANIGAHSLPLARAVGRDGVVVAVEPTDYAFCRLQANAALNPDLQSRLILVQAALTAQTDGPGPKENARFYSRWPLSGGGPDRHRKHLGELETAKGARFLTLDTLLQEVQAKHGINRPIAFLKLDVDGHELDVLRGATQLLTAQKPPILIEIGPHVQDELPQRFEQLIGIFEGHGYRLETGDTGKKFPLSAPALRGLIGDGATIDVIARADIEEPPT